jgi:hypothetical protein
MQEIFCEILNFFFHFLPENYADHRFLQKKFFNMFNKLHITDTESKIWFNSPNSDARVHNARNVFENPWFFFIFH